MSVVPIDTGNGDVQQVEIPNFDTMSASDQAQAVAQFHQFASSSGAAPASPADTSYTSALGFGLHSAAEGLGKTAELVGHATGWDGLEVAGKSLEGATTAPANYQPTTIAADLKAGNYRHALSQLPRAAAEGAPDMAGYIGAGALAGPVGIASMAAARNLGDNVASRAANNNDADPTASDWLAGGATTAAQSALAAVGLGKVALPFKSPILQGASILTAPLGAAARDAVAGATSDAVGQVGASAGTSQGVVYDPYQSAAAGLQAGVGRLASKSPDIVQGGVKAGSDAAMSALQPAPASPEDAASVVRVNQDYQAALKTAKDKSPQAVMNSVKSDYVASARDTITALKSAPDGANITTAQARSLTDAFNQAQRHNNTLTTGDASLFSQINNLDLPDEAVGTLKQAALDLNTLSTQSFQNQANGPFRQIGKGLATVGAVGGALATGHPLAAVGIMAGHSQVGGLGGAIGGMADRMFGTNTPTALLQARKAQAMLTARGMAAGTSSLTGLQNLADTTNALPRPDTSSVDYLAQQRLDTMTKANAVKLRIADAGRLPTPDPEIGDTAVDAALNTAFKQADSVVAQAGGSAAAPAAKLPAMFGAAAIGQGFPQTPVEAPPEPSTTLPPQVPTAAPTLPSAPLPGVSEASPAPAPTAPPPGPPPTRLLTAPASAGTGVERYIGKRFPTASIGDVHAAIDAVHAPETAAWLKAQQGADPAYMQPVIDHMGQQAQAAQLAQVGIPSANPVRNPLAYQGSIDNYRATVLQQIAQAHADGQPEAAAGLQAVMDAHDADPASNQLAKAAARDQHLSTLKTAKARAAAKAYFTPAIMRHGPKSKG